MTSGHLDLGGADDNNNDGDDKIKDIVDRVHGLSDLELAVLLSLVSHEHCVIGTPEDAVDSLVDELGLVSLGVFGLRCVVVDCHQDMTLDDFATSLLLPPVASPAPSAMNNDGHRHQGQHHPSSTAPGPTTDYFHLSPPRRPSQSSYTRGPRSPRSPMSNLPTAGTVASASAHSAASAAVSASASASTSAAPAAMANVVLAKNLNCAPEAVQIQALELMRTHHIFTATALQPAPKPFLLIAVVAAERGFFWDGGTSSDSPKPTQNPLPPPPDTHSHHSRGAGGKKRAPHMTAHLNDFFSMGHWHDPEYGYPNIEEREDAEAEADADADADADAGEEDYTTSYHDDADAGTGTGTGTDSDSVIRLSESGRRGRRGSINTSHSVATSKSGALGRSPFAATAPHTTATATATATAMASPPVFSEADIDHLTARSKEVRVDIEVLRYQMNILAFLRVYRAVAVVGPTTSGLSCVSPVATKHFEKLAQCLAPLHRLDYVTPALVALAARKTYLHRIRTVPVGHSGARLSAVHERSMQWGSEKAAVEALLEGVSPEVVIESVLSGVVPPI